VGGVGGGVRVRGGYVGVGCVGPGMGWLVGWEWLWVCVGVCRCVPCVGK
jgi:hypothetical protein